MKASYSPSFGAKILKQIIAMIGWDSSSAGANCVYSGARVWGRGAIKSLVTHSTGKREAVFSCDGIGNFSNNTRIGLVNASNDFFLVFVVGYAGTSSKTGVCKISKPSLSWLTDFQLFFSPAVMSKESVYKISVDFDSLNAKFVVLDSEGVVLHQAVFSFPADEYRLYFLSDIEIGSNDAVLCDFTASDFDVAPGYKAWDAL